MVAYLDLHTVKPSHAVTCSKRSPFPWPVIENFIWIEPLLRCHLSYKATFSLSQRWPLNTGLTVYDYPPRYNWNIVESGVKHHSPKIQNI